MAIAVWTEQPDPEARPFSAALWEFLQDHSASSVSIACGFSKSLLSHYIRQERQTWPWATARSVIRYLADRHPQVVDEYDWTAKLAVEIGDPGLAIMLHDTIDLLGKATTKRAPVHPRSRRGRGEQYKPPAVVPSGSSEALAARNLSLSLGYDLPLKECLAFAALHASEGTVSRNRMQLAASIDNEHNLRVLISRMRRKGVPIETDRGFGYRLCRSALRERVGDAGEALDDMQLLAVT